MKLIETDFHRLLLLLNHFCLQDIYTKSIISALLLVHRLYCLHDLFGEGPLSQNHH